MYCAGKQDATLAMGRRIYPYTRRIILALELMAVETAHDSGTGRWNAAIHNFLQGGVTMSKRNPSEAVPDLAMSIVPMSAFSNINFHGVVARSKRNPSEAVPHSAMSPAPMSTSSNIGLYYSARSHSPGCFTLELLTRGVIEVSHFLCLMACAVAHAEWSLEVSARSPTLR